MSDASSARVNMLLAARAELDVSTYDEVLLEVTARVAAEGSIGKLDIAALTTWKRLRASTTWVRELMNTPESEIRAKTEVAVLNARDSTVPIPDGARAARMALLKVPGCGHGPALASALLLAASPDRMAVYDSRAQRTLDDVLPSSHSKTKRGQLGYGAYMSVVVSLMDEVNVSSPQGHGWLPRDVDLALYQLGERPKPAGA